MITIIDKPFYKCSYCNKYSISKGAMQKHENSCWQNPKNQTQCFSCENYGRNMYHFEVQVPIDINGNTESKIIEHEFPFCNKKQLFVVNPKFTRKRAYKENGFNEPFLFAPNVNSEKCSEYVFLQ